jgi:hypothetical protein
MRGLSQSLRELRSASGFRKRLTYMMFKGRHIDRSAILLCDKGIEPTALAREIRMR